MAACDMVAYLIFVLTAVCLEANVLTSHEDIKKSKTDDDDYENVNNMSAEDNSVISGIIRDDK